MYLRNNERHNEENIAAFNKYQDTFNRYTGHAHETPERCSIYITPNALLESNHISKRK